MTQQQQKEKLQQNGAAKTQEHILQMILPGLSIAGKERFLIYKKEEEKSMSLSGMCRE